MRTRLIFAGLACALPTLALAQKAPVPADLNGNPVPISMTQPYTVWTPQEWEQAFESYVSASGGTARSLTISGGSASGLALSASTIDATPIGSKTPSNGAFTTLSASGTLAASAVSVTGGSINGTSIGASAPAAGAFSSLTAPSVSLTASQVASAVLAAPSGSAGAPAFRQLGVADITGAASLAGATFLGTVTTPSLAPDQVAHGSAGTNNGSGLFVLNTTQGNTLCQAPEPGQLTSATGTCLQYIPSFQQQGGAAGIFGLQGPTADYTSPALTIAVAGNVGDTSITVASDPSIANLSMVPGTGQSTFTSSVSGAIPAGAYFVPPANATGTQVAFVPGANTTVIPLSAALTASLPVGSTVSFVTPTSGIQYTALAGSAYLGAHQTAGQAWGGNFIVQADPGSSGNIHGLEIDTSNFSSHTGGNGVWLGNNGNNQMLNGFFAGKGVNGSGYLYGVQITGAVNDDFLSGSADTAGAVLLDVGTHTNGAYFAGNYSSDVLSFDDNVTTNITSGQRQKFRVTNQGGVIDASTVYTAAGTGGTFAAVNGSTGAGLVCSGTVAAFTVTLPTVPRRGQTYRVISECTITSLTVGSTAYGNVTPSTPINLVYDADRGKWVAADYIPGTTLYIGKGSPISDANTPLQIDSAVQGQAFFGVDKSGGYGLLIGYLGNYGQIRQTTTDPLQIQVNNNVTSEQLNSDKSVSFYGTVSIPTANITALTTTGHFSGTGGTAPTASTGTLVTGSSDTRGAVTLAGGTTASTVTFASAFASAPFCILTGSGTADTKAVTSISTTALAIGLSANSAGETVYWHCMQ